MEKFQAMNRAALLTMLLALASLSPASPAQGVVKLEVKGVEPDDTFTLSASASETRLTLDLQLEPGWHMYGPGSEEGQPVQLTIQKGSCFEAAGKLSVPTDGKDHVTGKARITLPLRRKAKGGTLRLSFSFMVCDAMMCFPPREITLQTSGLGLAPKMKMLKVLLVTLDDEKRSGRIKSFLEGRGFSCSVSHYKDVSLEGCDRFDLVIADSPNADKETSRSSMRARQQAVTFPETRSPIIAVGYLGTVLLEAHRIAMACGYI